MKVKIQFVVNQVYLPADQLDHFPYSIQRDDSCKIELGDGAYLSGFVNREDDIVYSVRLWNIEAVSSYTFDTPIKFKQFLTRTKGIGVFTIQYDDVVDVVTVKDGVVRIERLDVVKELALMLYKKDPVGFMLRGDVYHND